MKILKKAALILGVLALIAITPAFAADVYVAQSAAGASNGSSCSNAAAWNYFAVAGNWQPGTTFHICGTYNGAPGGTGISVLGSGSASSPITITFEPGAQLNAPYWGSNGAINVNGHSHLVIDGGTNGTIQNTANGTTLGYQQPSNLIYSGNNCNDLEIKDLAINNVYQIVGDDEGNVVNWLSTSGVNIDTGCDNVRIHNNSISMSRTGIWVAYTQLTSLQVYSNTIDSSSWMIVILDDNGGSSAIGVSVHDNNLGPHFQLFQDSGQNAHGDGIFVGADNQGSSMTASVYNNYVHGDMGTLKGNSTGYILVAGGQTNSTIFNNVVSQDICATTGPGVEALMVIRGEPGPTSPNGLGIYNNTFSSAGNCAPGIKTDDGGGGSSGTGFVLSNNLFISLGNVIMSGLNNFNQISASNNNVFFNISGSIASSNITASQPNFLKTLANWQSTTIAGGAHPDLNSGTQNPSLNANFFPQAPISIGQNLMSLSIAPLESDKAGVARPGSGSWTVGAYQTAGSAPAPPLGLTALVQ